MQVKLGKQYPVAADLDSAWKVLSDLPQLAACMPGAQITERVDDTHYKGQVNVKVGPASAAFGGTIELLAVNAANRTIRLQGKGADRGGSSASMDLTASLKPGAAPAACVLDGASEVIVNGKFAQFGGRMMGSVSELILAQFAENFSRAAAALATTAGGATAAGTAAAPTPIAPTQLNAFALVWQLIKGFFLNLFGRRPAS